MPEKLQEESGEEVEAYSSFARVYDLFMDNVPYEEWCEYLKSLLQEYDIRDGLILDLGCGTGKMTRLLTEAGYDMIGVDNSEEMLEIAREAEYDGKADGAELKSDILKNKYKQCRKNKCFLLLNINFVSRLSGNLN